MGQFKVKNTNSGNEYYFLRDQLRIEPVPLNARLYDALDDSRSVEWERGFFRLVIEGVWQVPPTRSHPTTEPKGASDIWALAMTEGVVNDRAIEVYPSITTGTEGDVEVDGSKTTGQTAINVTTSGADYDINPFQVVEFGQHSDRYIVQNGTTSLDGNVLGTFTIADPGLTTGISDAEDITLYQGIPLSVYPDPEQPPETYRTERGDNRVERSLTFQSDATYPAGAHIWDLLSDLTAAV